MFSSPFSWLTFFPFLLFLLFIFFLALPCGRSALHSTMTTILFVFFPQLNARLKPNGILRMECFKKKKPAQKSSFPFLFPRCLVPCCSFGFCFLTSKNVRCPFSVTVFLFRCMVLFLRFYRRLFFHASLAAPHSPFVPLFPALFFF